MDHLDPVTTSTVTWLDALAGIPDAFGSGVWAGLAALFGALALAVPAVGLGNMLASTSADWLDEALLLLGLVGGTVCGVLALGVGAGAAGAAGAIVAIVRGLWAVRARLLELWQALVSEWRD